VFVPRDWTQPIDISVEEAMRASMFAWMSTAKNGDLPNPTKP
jgi:hypothetical protein